MNIVFIKHFFVGFVISEIPRVSVLGYFPISRIFDFIDKYLRMIFILYI